MTLPRISAALAVIAAAVLTASCAPLPGSASRDPDANLDVLNLALLDPGGYPTTPRAPFGDAGTMAVGRHLEALRLAEVIAMPFEIDSTFTEMKSPALALTDPFGLDMQLSVPIGRALARHGFLAGYVTSATQKRNTSIDLTSALFRFPTDKDAAAAATDLGAQTERDPDPAQVRFRPTLLAFPLPEYPNTTAVIGKPRDSYSLTTLYAYTAHGPFVLAQKINIATPEKAVALMGRAIEIQTDMLAGFEPTPVDDLVDLPIDPEGLLARTLPAGSLAVDPEQGIYGPHGVLTLADQPVLAQKVFVKAGMQSMAKALVNVYQARDAQGAQEIVDAFAAKAAANNFTAAGAMAGVPSARCAMSPQSPVAAVKPHFRCVAAVQRYVVEVTAADETDAHQRMAAQILMLSAGQR